MVKQCQRPREGPKMRGCKGVFSTKFRKKSKKRTENLPLLLEKIENFQLFGGGGIHSPTSPRFRGF